MVDSARTSHDEPAASQPDPTHIAIKVEGGAAAMRENDGKAHAAPERHLTAKPPAAAPKQPPKPKFKQTPKHEEHVMTAASVIFSPKETYDHIVATGVAKTHLTLAKQVGDCLAGGRGLGRGAAPGLPEMVFRA